MSLAVAFSLFQFTQTSTGRNAAIVLLQGALENAVDGTVRIGPVLGGNLITRAVVSSFEIADAGGRTFVSMDSVTIEYDPLLLLRRQVRIRRLEAAFAEIRLAVDATGQWNFERIFGGDDFLVLPPASGAEDPVADSARLSDTVSVSGDEPDPGNPLRLIITDAVLRDGVLEIRTPWTEGLEGRERDRAFAEARSEGSIWYAEETATGEFERVYRVEGMSGSFSELRLIDPPRPLDLRLENVAGRVRMVSLPLDVRSFSGAVTFGDTVRVGIDRFETDESDLSGTGILVPDSILGFDFDLEAERMGFADLAWLPLPLPRTGGGPMNIGLISRGETPIVTVSGARVRSEDTEIRGGFRFAVERAPRFESLDATFEPLRLSWLDEVLGREPTIDGTAVGTLTGAGRIDALDIDAEL
ncbi:MAG: hypothetical protein OEU54_17660, partial [Gemmatimonadota bacterium]|nr:hypothetical protein [Gemmatimonadota bacterium]